MPGRRPALLLAWACLLAREVSAWSHSETSLAQSVLSRALPVSEDVLNDFKKMTPPDAVISSRIVAFSLSSFLVGVAAGVVATLLILGVLTDRIPRIHMPQKDEEAAVAAGAPERDNPEQAAAASTTCSTSSSLPEAGLPAESLHLFMPRCSWLAAMLLVQSASTLIMQSFRVLIAEHLELAFFLTMLVGLGGNAGGQSVVLTVREITRGRKAKVADQAWIGVRLAAVLAPLAGMRAWLQPTPWRSSCAIGASAAVICVVATCLGAALPVLLQLLEIDPAHSTVVVQVLMDITGIMVVCGLGYMIL